MTGMGQPTGWDAQPHILENDEALAAWLEGCAGRLEVFWPGFFFPFDTSGLWASTLGKGFGIPRVPSWTLFYVYNFEETLKNKMKYEYLHDDGDVFIDYSWERALSIYGDVYLEWCLEFLSTMYFDKGVDRTKWMMEKCIWFKLCGVEKVLTLREFMVLLGLYEEYELKH
ncbi:hypothetical protein Tco_0780041, partial [Tanacetum coccineum]